MDFRSLGIMVLFHMFPAGLKLKYRVRNVIMNGDDMNLIYLRQIGEQTIYAQRYTAHGSSYGRKLISDV